MSTLNIVDDDKGTISAEIRGRSIREWSYRNDDERRSKIRGAREFAEGWWQATRSQGPHTQVGGVPGDIDQRETSDSHLFDRCS